MRIVLALGGNAMTASDGRSTPDDQRAAIAVAAEHIARLVAAGHEVVVTHGNGPQVGNILLKNELSAHRLTPVSLDWCGAQTQGTIGFTLMNALERALAAQDAARPVATLVSRTVVDADDPAFTSPTKAIGPYGSADHAAAMTAAGQAWRDEGPKGWRRVVASPEPLQIVDAPAVAALLAQGFLVVSSGGGGIPVVPDPRGGYQGVEAVIDKDLTATLLSRQVEADLLVIATDVEHAVLGWGTPQARPLGQVRAAELRAHIEAGEFGVGSMLPKVEAVTRFVESGGPRAVVTDLASITEAADGGTGTVVVP
ncbi:carbamate kinase [Ornithinimicrobium pekingense]|uniref:Carbamate kinase n=1 Tax=Ornithinimicrobium pekingense TaxID=384677 RepID=A0ABQ2FCT6_9MICO|nr:carbamate kinase [Ornithinimicrobium pekingense]GGK80826.1 carbamate kinase [Ornithinimicrobium pekingense]